MLIYLVSLARLHADLRHARAIGNALGALHHPYEPVLVFPLTPPSQAVKS